MSNLPDDDAAFVCEFPRTRGWGTYSSRYQDQPPGYTSSLGRGKLNGPRFELVCAPQSPVHTVPPSPRPPLRPRHQACPPLGSPTTVEEGIRQEPGEATPHTVNLARDKWRQRQITQDNTPVWDIHPPSSRSSPYIRARLPRPILWVLDVAASTCQRSRCRHQLPSRAGNGAPCGDLCQSRSLQQHDFVADPHYPLSRLDIDRFGFAPPLECAQSSPFRRRCFFSP